MQTPRKVPGIAHQRPNISMDRLPPVQSPMAMPPMQEQQQDEGDDLAMEIYARLAVDQIASAQAAKPELLRVLALASRQAAAIYFEETGK